jgi:hypothetical protein
MLGVLCDKTTLAANEKKTMGLMYHVQMFGYLAQYFKTDLRDPLDKPPDVVKTVRRIQDTIYSFFKANHRLVWRGCSVSL